MSLETMLLAAIDAARYSFCWPAAARLPHPKLSAARCSSATRPSSSASTFPGGTSAGSAASRTSCCRARRAGGGPTRRRERDGDRARAERLRPIPDSVLLRARGAGRDPYVAAYAQLFGQLATFARRDEPPPPWLRPHWRAGGVTGAVVAHLDFWLDPPSFAHRVATRRVRPQAAVDARGGLEPSRPTIK